VLLKHKDHNYLEIQEATEKIKREMESISFDDEIKNVEESIEEINENISKRNEKFEKELKELKNEFQKDLIVFDDSKCKMKEKLNRLKEVKGNLKTSNILDLLKMKNELEVEVGEFFKQVYSFGDNSEGQLGLGNTTNQNIPQLITLMKNEKIKNVVCGGYHTIITTGN
jgi:alpha-tubulin suppressor-like RCC1 family protein